MSILPRLLNSWRRKRKLWELKVQYRKRQGDLVVDYGVLKLPFSNDDDLQEIYYHLHCEEWYTNERDTLSDYVARGATVIDVGANLGFMAAVFAELVGDEGSVFAFEPSPRIFKKLQRFIEINSLSNVEPVNYGCGAEEKPLTLYQVGPSSGNASLVPEDADSHRQGSETVNLITLDEFVLPRIEKVDFIKIDTEGYESEVLKGSIHTLKRDKPGLYVELSQEYKDSSLEAIQILEGLGYQFVEKPDLTVAHNGANFIAV